MRIGIDARFLTHPQVGGFKSYTENLIRALAEVDERNDYFLYVDREPSSDTLIPSQPNVRARIVPAAPRPIGMPWREQWRLPRAAARDRLDLLHLPALTGPLYLQCPSVVTVHDTIWLGSPSARLRRPWRPLYYRAVGRRAAARAAAILTPSRASRESIVRDLGIPAERVTVTYEAPRRGCGPADPTALAAFLRRHRLEAGYVLGLASSDPRKNLPALVGAFAQLPAALQKQHSLVIAGSMQRDPSFVSSATSRILGPLSDEEMVLLYNAAAVFVFPSLSEGFGLPLLEAMACSTPVVAANNSSIPEVAGDAAVLVDAHDTQGLAQAITRVLDDSAWRAELIERGLRRVATFSWERCARETLAVYQRIGASSGGESV
jgi:glycosyltransferase involved in cell wall biosynthesis